MVLVNYGNLLRKVCILIYTCTHIFTLHWDGLTYDSDPYVLVQWFI